MKSVPALLCPFGIWALIFFQNTYIQPGEVAGIQCHEFRELWLSFHISLILHPLDTRQVLFFFQMHHLLDLVQYIICIINIALYDLTCFLRPFFMLDMENICWISDAMRHVIARISRYPSSSPFAALGRSDRICACTMWY